MLFKENKTEKFELPKLEWPPPNTTDESYLITKVDFITEANEKYLISTIKRHALLQMIIIGVIAFLFAILNFTVFKLFTHIISMQQNYTIDYFLHDKIFIFLSITSIEYIVIAVFLIVSRTQKHYLIGNKPKNLLLKEYIEQPLYKMKMAVAYLYQNRIEVNMKAYQKLSFAMKTSIILSFIFPFITLLLIFII
jgi:magnesium-transporting ATPase (P-type)